MVATISSTRVTIKNLKRLSFESLDQKLCGAISSIKPDPKKLCSCKQVQISHSNLKRFYLKSFIQIQYLIFLLLLCSYFYFHSLYILRKQLLFHHVQYRYPHIPSRLPQMPYKYYHFISVPQ